MGNHQTRSAGSGAPARIYEPRSGQTHAQHAERPAQQAAADVDLQIQCYQCRGLMNLNQRGPVPPRAVQCPYCNTINGIGGLSGRPRPGGLIQTDLESLLRREDGRRGGGGGSGARDNGTVQVVDMNDELMRRLQQFRRMNHAELMLVREVLSQLQQSGQTSNGATNGQIDRLTVSWKVTESTTLASPTCTICLEAFETGQDVRTLPCFHTFHAGCVEEWLTKNKVCPICQFDIARGVQGERFVTEEGEAQGRAAAGPS